MNHMTIVSGASSFISLKSRIENGAKEVFLGYIDANWYKDFGILVSPNRRWGKKANFFLVEEIEKAIFYAHAHSVDVSLALNAHKYTDYELEKILYMLDEIIPLGINNIIVSDYTICKKISGKYPYVNIHISTGGVVFNSASIQFYKALGAKRVIFPRSLNVDEVIEIASNDAELEYEVFMSGSRCANIDGLCNFEHAIMNIGKQCMDNYPMCSLKYKLQIYSSEKLENSKKVYLTDRIKEKMYFNSYPRACAACYLYDFYKVGIYYVKVPARAMSVGVNNEIVNNDLEFIRQCINKIESSKSTEDFKDFVRTFHEKYYGYPCYEYCRDCYY